VISRSGKTGSPVRGNGTRKIMQNFFNKFSVRTQEVIISGKPGTVLATPLAGITVAGVLPSGAKLFSGITGANGFAVFPDFMISFVSKGSMLYLKPDFAITSQASSYAHAELEQTILKLENDVTIVDTAHRQLAGKQTVVFEKGYEKSVPIPLGLFFWEAAGKSTRMIKDMVVGL
jgi:hypothetical protein